MSGMISVMRVEFKMMKPQTFTAVTEIESGFLIVMWYKCLFTLDLYQLAAICLISPSDLSSDNA